MAPIFSILLIFEKNMCISDLLTILVFDMCYHARKTNYFPYKGKFDKSGILSMSRENLTLSEKSEGGHKFLHIYRN